MRKCHRCVVVKASEQNMAIEPAEARKVRRAGAAKSFGVKVEKMSLNQISRHLVPKTVNLHNRNGRAYKLAFNSPPSDIGLGIRLHHPLHDDLVFHFRILQQSRRRIATMEHSDHVFDRIVLQALVQVLWNAMVNIQNADRAVRSVLGEKLGDQRVTIVLTRNWESALSHSSVNKAWNMFKAHFLFRPALGRCSR